jgi:hypothetical protein
MGSGVVGIPCSEDKRPLWRGTDETVGLQNNVHPAALRFTTPAVIVFLVRSHVEGILCRFRSELFPVKRGVEIAMIAPLNVRGATCKHISSSHAVVAGLCSSSSRWACRRQVSCCNPPISFKVDILCFLTRLASKEATSISSNAWPLFNKLSKKQRIHNLNVSCFQILDTFEFIHTHKNFQLLTVIVVSTWKESGPAYSAGEGDAAQNNPLERIPVLERLRCMRLAHHWHSTDCRQLYTIAG